MKGRLATSLWNIGAFGFRFGTREFSDFIVACSIKCYEGVVLILNLNAQVKNNECLLWWWGWRLRCLVFGFEVFDEEEYAEDYEECAYYEA